MARGKYQRRGHPSASPSPETKVEPVSMDALNTPEPVAPAVPDAILADTPIEAPKPKMVTVKLLRNYRPMERPDPADKKNRLPPEFEVLGYWKPPVIVRNKQGKEEVLTPAEFVEGENAPPPQAGVGFADKLWAGTVVRFLTDEAKYIRANGIGEIEIDD